MKRPWGLFIWCQNWTYANLNKCCCIFPSARPTPPTTTLPAFGSAGWGWGWRWGWRWWLRTFGFSIEIVNSWARNLVWYHFSMARLTISKLYQYLANVSWLDGTLSFDGGDWEWYGYTRNIYWWGGTESEYNVICVALDSYLLYLRWWILPLYSKFRLSTAFFSFFLHDEMVYYFFNEGTRGREIVCWYDNIYHGIYICIYMTRHTCAFGMDSWRGGFLETMWRCWRLGRVNGDRWRFHTNDK